MDFNQINGFSTDHLLPKMEFFHISSFSPKCSKKRKNEVNRHFQGVNQPLGATPKQILKYKWSLSLKVLIFLLSRPIFLCGKKPQKRKIFHKMRKTRFWPANEVCSSCLLSKYTTINVSLYIFVAHLCKNTMFKKLIFILYKYSYIIIINLKLSTNKDWKVFPNPTPNPMCDFQYISEKLSFFMLLPNPNSNQQLCVNSWQPWIASTTESLCTFCNLNYLNPGKL